MSGGGKILQKTPEDARFKVGEYVKIASCGQIYGSYRGMANAMGLDIRKFENSQVIKDDRIKKNLFTIQCVRKHEDGDSILYAVENNSWLVIIGEDGLSVTTVNSLPEELFEI